MRDDDLLRLVWIADPQISPDGRRVAFTRVVVDEQTDAYETAIWLAEVDGGAPPRALTFGKGDSQPRWSPDGQSLAFVRKGEGKQGDGKSEGQGKNDPDSQAQIHVLPLAGGEARQLTRLAKGASQPAWSPDGRRLAFLSGTNPALDDAAPEKPKNAPGRVVTRPVWRFNGAGFLDWEHLDQVWVQDVDGAAARQLTTGDFAAGAPRWSADGQWLCFLADRRLEPWYEEPQNALYAVSPELAAPTEGAELQTIAAFQGYLGSFALAPDGRLAGIGSLGGHAPRSYDQEDLLLLEGDWPRSAPVVVTADFDFDIGGGSVGSDQHPPRGGGAMPLAFDAAGDGVLTVVGRHGAARLARVRLADGAVTLLTDENREVIAGSLTPDGRRAALCLGDVARPGVLAVWDAASGTVCDLWDPNAELLAAAGLGEVEGFWYDSFDGQRIQAWLVKPADFDPARRYPLILQIHGGPHTAYGVGFFHEFRALAAAGYLVLYTNPRGSTTYGQDFANVIQYRYPGDDAKDLLAAVDLVVARGYVEPSRLGVTGGSGGGLLTNWLIAHDHRFAAAITQRCVSDWLGFYHSADFSMFTPFWFRRPPHEDASEYLERSPVRLAAQIETPLMVIHSEEDWRTPIGQGEAMFRALKQQKKPTVMVRFPGESHELSRSGAPSRRVQNQQHIRRWFDRWLMGKEAPEYGV